MSAEASLPTSPIRILVVEDEPSLLDVYLEEFKGKGGFRVQSAKNGAEAFVQFRNSPTELIVCDYRMPKMTGFELFQQIRNLKLNPEPTFIFVTSSPEDVRKDLGINPDTFIVEKPCNFDELFVLIEAILLERNQKKPPPPAKDRKKNEAVIKGVVNGISKAAAQLASGNFEMGMSFHFGQHKPTIDISSSVSLKSPDGDMLVTLGFPEDVFQSFIRAVLTSTLKTKISGYDKIATQTLSDGLVRARNVLETNKVTYVEDSILLTGSDWNPKVVAQSPDLVRVTPIKSTFGTFYVIFS